MKIYATLAVAATFDLTDDKVSDVIDQAFAYAESILPKGFELEALTLDEVKE